MGVSPQNHRQIGSLHVVDAGLMRGAVLAFRNELQ